MKKYLLSVFLITGIILVCSSHWIVSKFGTVTAEQLLFHFYMPLEADLKLNVSLARAVLVPVALVFLCLFMLRRIPKLAKINRFVETHFAWLSVGCFLFGAAFFVWKLNFIDLLYYYSHKTNYSSFYETYYTDANKTEVRFPTNKKNLVMIFLESIETTYINSVQENLLPNLSKIADNHLNFSHSNGIGGAYPVSGTNWTIAGLVAQTCGLPLRMPIDANKFEQYSIFLPKAKCLNEFLRENGYTLSFMEGSNSSFAGMDVYLREHGNPDVKDYTYFRKNKLIPHDYKVYWGIEDRKLYDFAKQELTELSKQKEPFAFTMMTIDSHKADGYFEDAICQRRYDKEYENVISCADQQIGDFMKWMEKQPFYENTVVVIVGDHLGMSPVIEKLPDRHQINLFIHAPKTLADKNRRFTPFDIYPTVLEGLGAEIQGGRLALGTSLFSGEKTIMEQGLSHEEINRKVMERSKVYDYLFYGRQID